MNNAGLEHRTSALLDQFHALDSAIDRLRDESDSQRRRDIAEEIKREHIGKIQMNVGLGLMEAVHEGHEQHSRWELETTSTQP